MKIKEVMKPSKAGSATIVLNENESLDNAAIVLKHNNINAIKIINEAGNIVGEITRDIIIENSDDLNEEYLLD